MSLGGKKHVSSPATLVTCQTLRAPKNNLYFFKTPRDYEVHKLTFLLLVLQPLCEYMSKLCEDVIDVV